MECTSSETSFFLYDKFLSNEWRFTQMNFTQIIKIKLDSRHSYYCWLCTLCSLMVMRVHGMLSSEATGSSNPTTIAGYLAHSMSSLHGLFVSSNSLIWIPNTPLHSFLHTNLWVEVTMVGFSCFSLPMCERTKNHSYPTFSDPKKWVWQKKNPKKKNGVVCRMGGASFVHFCMQSLLLLQLKTSTSIPDLFQS
jgi:hypothetical protein